MKIPTATKSSEPHRENGFPLDVFPARIQEIVMEYNKAFKFNEDWLGLTMLTALSSAIGAGYRMELKEKLVEPSIIWAILVGRSGTKKTHVVNHLFKPFIDLDNERFRDYQRNLDEYNASKDKDKDKGKPPQFHPAALENFTFEALIESSIVNPHGCIVLSDEILGFTKNMNAFNKGSDEPRYLTMYSGGRIVLSRKTQEARYAERSNVNIIGGIQPTMLRELLTKNRLNNGFAQRFLFSFPDADYQELGSFNLDERLFDDYNASIRGIIKSGNPNKPIILKPDSKAWNEYLHWQRENAQICNQLAKHDEVMAGLRSKWESYVCRFALILQVVTSYCRDGSQPKGIEKEAVLGAIRLFDHFLKYSQKAFDLIERPSELDNLSELNLKFYNNLDERFTKDQAEKIAESLGISQATMYRILEKKKLFKRIKQGVYEKAVM